MYYDETMHTVTLKDDSYPFLLKEISHPPEQLYYEGAKDIFERADAQERRRVAIVGTRRPTRYGIEMAHTLSRDLASAGIIIVSGLALGIDAAAHQGALEGGGETWAVLGSGLSHIYPASHRGLAKKIVEQNGTIISEFSPEQVPQQWTFPQRNRVIAGLAHATIVVEAPEKSGALITARFALDANREVGAVPGEATSVHSQGTLALLKEGAALVTEASDVLTLLGVPVESKKQLFLDNMSGMEQDILRYLEAPRNVEELVLLLGCPVEDMYRHLTFLEMHGLVRNQSGLITKM